MKITLELLGKYNANQQLMAFFRKYYPAGVDVIEFFNSEHSTAWMIHFIRKYFSLSEEEIAAYNKICDIDESSKRVLYSSLVRDSEDIISCTSIEDTKVAINSSNVKNSLFIYNSRDIKDSDNIYNCERVRRSHLILDSQDIVKSRQVARSNLITYGECITNSFLLEDCQHIYFSDNLYDCWLSGFLKNSKHCICCFGLKDSDYYIFNEKVDPVEFERIKEELHYRLTSENPTFVQFDQKSRLPEERFHADTRFDSVFEGLSADFYGWLSTLPNYSEEAFLNVFFKDRKI